jgi:hydrogenase/urease accessory protein HupE
MKGLFFYNMKKELLPGIEKDIRLAIALRLLFVLFLSMSANIVFAHDVVKDIESLSVTASAVLYLRLGYQHILPLGLDHILFVVSLFLLSPKLKTMLWQSLTFTIAHSVTLGLATYKVITVPASIVEPLIALSIAYVALENVLASRLKPSRIAVVFVFGLVHGLGFASALGDLGLPPGTYLVSLLLFNAGVELGQLTVILLAFFLVGKWFGHKPWYRKIIVTPLSLLIAGIALWWFIQRVSI